MAVSHLWSGRICELPVTWRIHGGARGRSPPPQTGAPKKFIARPKNTHICKPPFACQNVLKLTYSYLEFQNFPGETPGPPLQGEGRRGGKGRMEGKDREGGEGREGTGEGGRGGMGGGEGMGARHGLRPPPRDKLWIRPCGWMAHIG